MDFDGSEKKLEKKLSKTRINERDLVVQGPGFGSGFDNGLFVFSSKRDFLKVDGIRA